MDMTDAVEETVETIDQDVEPDVDDPVHLARCAECGRSVRFRSNVTGTGFFLIDADPDATFGVGPSGRPICPDGHGEMGLADDQLKSVPDAFADAQTMLLNAEREAVQRELPGVRPPFNWAGAGRDMADQAVRVDGLRLVYEDAADKAKKAKKSWDEAEELLTKMGVEYARRARAKDEPDPVPFAAPSPRLVKCTWEVQHATETCPLCSGEVAPDVLEEMLGNPSALAPADAEAHVGDVDRFNTAMDVETTREALEAIDIFIVTGEIEGWTAEDRQAVLAYVHQQDDIRNAVDIQGDRLERPTVLGRPHVPGRVDENGHQRCSVCEALVSDADVTYEATDLIGTDCPGAPKEGHRYPARGKKKTVKTMKGARK